MGGETQALNAAQIARAALRATQSSAAPKPVPQKPARIRRSRPVRPATPREPMFAGTSAQLAHAAAAAATAARTLKDRIVTSTGAWRAPLAAKAAILHRSDARPEADSAISPAETAQVATLPQRDAEKSIEAQPTDGDNEQPAVAADPMAEWRAVARRNFVTVGIFSVVVNLLMLTMPVYLFQISDRVLTSRSIDTLVMLSVLALMFIGVLSLLDILRRQVLGALSTKLETILGGPILASIVTTARAGDGGNITPLRSLHAVKSFIASPVMLLLFDAPLAPIYLAVVFLIHPDLGWITVGAAVTLITIAMINQRATSVPLGQAGAHAAKADGHAEALARNSQVINAMGMLNESILHWGREQAQALTTQSGALERNFWISGASKMARLITQIVDSRLGRLSRARWASDGRHDDRRLDHCRPRATAVGRHDRRLAQRRADARRLRPRHASCRSAQERAAASTPAAPEGPPIGRSFAVPAGR